MLHRFYFQIKILLVSMVLSRTWWSKNSQALQQAEWLPAAAFVLSFGWHVSTQYLCMQHWLGCSQSIPLSVICKLWIRNRKSMDYFTQNSCNCKFYFDLIYLLQLESQISFWHGEKATTEPDDVDTCFADRYEIVFGLARYILVAPMRRSRP